MSNPYQESYDHVRIVRDFVTEAIEDAMDNAKESRERVESLIDDLSGFAPQLSSRGSLPNAPVIDTTIEGEFNLPELGTESFGTVTGNVTAAPTLADVRTPGSFDVAPFTPSVAGLSIPEAPAMTAPEAGPERPALSDVTLPVAPALAKPVMQALDNITLPTFDFDSLPVWNSQAPEFQGTPVAAILQWSEPSYSTEVMDDVLAVIRNIWAGGNGIPAAVENAIWERAANREDLDTARAISAATIEFASRGFTSPPGMLVQRIDAIRDDAMLKKQSLSRDIATRMAELQVQNVKWACEQAVAAENVLFNIWNNMAQRQFEAAKIQLDSQLAMYNAQVALFNAQQSARATEAQIYKTQIEARIDTFKAQLEGEIARGTLNEQKVKIYSEQIRALLSDVEIYKAEMQGASLQAEMNRNVIEAFKADVQAYAERISADKVRFDAYDSRVKGELGKAQILDAEARAYASYVNGQASVADIGIKIMQGDISKNDYLIRKYLADLEADKTRMQYQVSAVQANAEAHKANTQRFTAVAGVEESKLRLEITAKEAEMRTSLALYEAEMRKAVADMEQLIRKATIQLEALKSAAQVGATMAAGAMAGINVGTNLSGSGGVSASGSLSRGVTKSNSTSFSVNAEAEGGSGSIPNQDW